MKKHELEQISDQAMYIAMVVRNQLEDFHCEHLSDEQMAKLNPLIRNAIYTALYALADWSPPAQAFVGFNRMLIPDYWEQPELTDGYTRLVEKFPELHPHP